eukprot:gene2957-1939_t
MLGCFWWAWYGWLRETGVVLPGHWLFGGGFCQVRLADFAGCGLCLRLKCVGLIAIEPTVFVLARFLKDLLLGLSAVWLEPMRAGSRFRILDWWVFWSVFGVSSLLTLWVVSFVSLLRRAGLIAPEFMVFDRFADFVIARFVSVFRWTRLIVKGAVFFVVTLGLLWFGMGTFLEGVCICLNKSVLLCARF